MLRLISEAARAGGLVAVACAVVGVCAGLGAGPAGASNFDTHPCFNKNTGRRIQSCSELLAQPGVPDETRAAAFAMRALEHSLIGRYPDAITDYDRALEISPDYPVALNNRAWAKFRMGDHQGAWPDVERSLALDPWSPHAYDTRGHLNHVGGRVEQALADYKRAMSLGGKEMVKLYQCGLEGHGHYYGPKNGIITDTLLLGLKACAEDKTCDPLPPDEKCNPGVS